MKKIIFIILIFIFLCFTNKASAVETEYYNLLDMTQVEYDAELDIFYSKQKIYLKAQTSYTLVVSTNFFGDVTKENKYVLTTDRFGTVFTDTNGEVLRMSFSLFPTSDGLLYFASARPSDDCFVEFTDFKTKGYTMENLPKSEIILYEGLKQDFKGFREIEYEEGYEKVEEQIQIYTNYDNPIKTEDITKQLRGYDNSSGMNVPVKLIKDSYTNSTGLGDYDLVYQVSDNSNLSTTLTVTVSVVDITPPTITGDDVVEWDCYNSVPTVDFFREKYNAIDNVDGDITDNIKIVDSSLDSYVTGTPGDYSVVLEVTDEAGNVFSRTVTLITSDITAPVLNVSDITLNLSTIGNSIFDNFFKQVIIDVSDNSGSYNIEVTAKEVIGTIGFAGEFEATVRVYDASGNETIKKAIIKVIDDIFPEFYMQTELITTTTKDQYSVYEIKEAIAENLHSQGILYDSIDLISCDYLSNENNPGEYTVKCVYNYKGESNYLIGTIKVSESEEEPYYWVLVLMLIPVLVGGAFVNKKRRNL